MQSELNEVKTSNTKPKKSILMFSKSSNALTLSRFGTKVNFLKKPKVKPPTHFKT